MSQVVIMIGVMCSGKTTYVEKKYKDHTRISWDSALVSLYPEENYGESIKKADPSKIAKTIDDQFTNAVSKGEDIVIDLCLMTKEFRKSYLDRIPEGYTKTAVVCTTGIHDIYKRNDIRKASGKFIKKDSINELLAKYQAPTYDEFHEIIYNCN